MPLYSPLLGLPFVSGALLFSDSCVSAFLTHVCQNRELYVSQNRFIVGIVHPRQYHRLLRQYSTISMAHIHSA